MIQLINIPTKSVDEAWGVVRTDIANALTRSNVNKVRWKKSGKQQFLLF